MGKNWKQPRRLSTCECLNYGIAKPQNTPKQQKDTCNNRDDAPGNYAECENAIPKRYVMNASIYTTFLKWLNHRNGEQVSGCHELRRRKGRWEVAIRDPCGDGNVLYLDNTTVSFLALMSYYSFATCYHWENLGEGGTWISLLTTACKSTINWKEKVRWKGKSICSYEKRYWDDWQVRMWAAYEKIVPILNPWLWQQCCGYVRDCPCF